MDGKLWRTIMEDNFMEAKLWRPKMWMANYRGQFMEANFIDGRFYRWQLNYVRRNDGS